MSTAGLLRNIIYEKLNEQGLVGTYELNGTELPACYVYPSVSNQATITGLEVIVSALPSSTRIGLLNDASMIEYEWSVRLVQWDSSASVQPAIEALYSTFTRMRVQVLEATDFSEEQAVVTVPQSAVYVKAKMPNLL